VEVVRRLCDPATSIPAFVPVPIDRESRYVFKQSLRYSHSFSFALLSLSRALIPTKSVLISRSGTAHHTPSYLKCEAYPAIHELHGLTGLLVHSIRTEYSSTSASSAILVIVLPFPRQSCVMLCTSMQSHSLVYCRGSAPCYINQRGANEHRQDLIAYPRQRIVGGAAPVAATWRVASAAVAGLPWQVAAATPESAATTTARMRRENPAMQWVLESATRLVSCVGRWSGFVGRYTSDISYV